MLLGTFGAVAWVGCAHGGKPQQSTSEVTDLRRQLADSQAREAELVRKVDELSNRLFIMQDQLEAREVASKQKAPPRLPVDARADRPVDEPQAAAEVVEYAGDARDAHAPRPVLRLVGTQSPSKSTGIEVGGEGPAIPVAAPPPSSHGRAPVARKEWSPPADGEGLDRLPVTHAVPPVPKGGAQPVAVASSAPPSSRQAAGPAPRALPPPVPTGISKGESVEAMKLYTASVDLLKHGQHAEAISGLQKFIRTFPSHDYADNAQYWLGECYYDQKDFKTALREFRRVVQHYPGGNKTPDALLKVGFCYWQLSDTGKARDVLEQVVKSYPGTEIAKKAQDKLQELK
jgi:tol-pal system protein YbgF